MAERAVIYVKLDSFFIGVELAGKPHLKGRPVVVSSEEVPSKRGTVLSASCEARRKGIKRGMTLRTARRLCQDIVILPPDFEAYERMSERFLTILSGFTPLVETFGLDIAFLEVNPVDAVRVGKEIKKRIRHTLSLTASVGVAPNKLLSCLAGEMKRPDGFSVIDRRDVEKILQGLPVRRLWGVGDKVEKRLRFLGINTVGELSRTPLEHLERNFGKDLARMLHNYSRGMDESPVVPFHEPDSITREVVFEHDTSDMYLIKETLYGLTKDVTGRLRNSSSRTGTIAIKVRYHDFNTLTEEKTFPEPTDSLNDIWSGVLELLSKIDISRKVRLVGVRASDIKKRPKPLHSATGTCP